MEKLKRVFDYLEDACHRASLESLILGGDDSLIDWYDDGAAFVSELMWREVKP